MPNQDITLLLINLLLNMYLHNMDPLRLIHNCNVKLMPL